MKFLPAKSYPVLEKKCDEVLVYRYVYNVRQVVTNRVAATNIWSRLPVLPPEVVLDGSLKDILPRCTPSAQNPGLLTDAQRTQLSVRNAHDIFRICGSALFHPLDIMCRFPQAYLGTPPISRANNVSLTRRPPPAFSPPPRSIHLHSARASRRPYQALIISTHTPCVVYPPRTAASHPNQTCLPPPPPFF